MKNFLNKIASRKFIACLIGIIVGIATTFGVDGNTITDVAGLIVALVSSVSYIIVEGNVDAKAVNGLKDSTIELLQTIEGEVIEDDTPEDKESGV